MPKDAHSQNNNNDNKNNNTDAYNVPLPADSKAQRRHNMKLQR